MYNFSFFVQGRSGEDDKVDGDGYADYSGEEEVVDEGDDEELDLDDEEEVDKIQDDEDIENAENQQKISSEKMNSSSLHRLHVEFDDLSVVDEEEELKKDKEKKDSVVILGDGQSSGDLVDLLPHEKTGAKIHSEDSSFRYYPAAPYDVQLATLTDAERKYFNECPFIFPNPSDPNYPKMVMSPCPKMYEGRLTPIPNLDAPSIGPIDSVFDTNAPVFGIRNSVTKNLANISPFNIRYQNSSNGTTPNSGESTIGKTGCWNFDGKIRNDNKSTDFAVPPLPDKPKHFFAPLPSKLRLQRSLDDGNSGQKILDTTTSSSSEKTCSTVVSRNRIKGTADLYVNGGFPLGVGSHEGFLTSNDLIFDESGQSSNNPLIKSLSCQDLSSSDPQNLPFCDKLKLFNDNDCSKKLITKSDNTLDNISNSSRPYKSQLNVTLRLPAKPVKVPSSPDTPEIPKLPAINYRLFSNPFLQSFDREMKNYPVDFGLSSSPTTRPLSIKVNENVSSATANGNPNYSNLESDYARLLRIAPNQFQVRGLDENPVRPGIGFEVTSFEGPNPQTFLAADRGETSRRIQEQQQQQQQRVFQQKLAHPGVQLAPRIFYNDNKVPAQTQTSLPDVEESPSHLIKFEPESTETQTPSVPGSPGSPLTLRRKRTLRKDRPGSTKDKRPLSPAAQRRKDRLRMKQGGGLSSPESGETPATKLATRKQSLTTSTSVDVHEKNESRSSSSGQDSPKKGDQGRRVSLYFNAKKRPAFTVSKTDRRSSNESAKDAAKAFAFRREPNQDVTTTNSERERTNSVSSRDTVVKGSRKLSTGSEKVPWCACWGNGCV